MSSFDGIEHDRERKVELEGDPRFDNEEKPHVEWEQKGWVGVMARTDEEARELIEKVTDAIDTALRNLPGIDCWFSLDDLPAEKLGD